MLKAGRVLHVLAGTRANGTPARVHSGHTPCRCQRCVRALCGLCPHLALSTAACMSGGKENFGRCLHHPPRAWDDNRRPCATRWNSDPYR